MKKFIRLPEVLEATGVSERFLYLMIKRGDFPRPAKIGAMSVWDEEEVAAWQQARLDERQSQTA